MFSRVQDFIKTNFFAGILFLAPLCITFYVFKLIVDTADESLRTAEWMPLYIPGIGIAVAFIIILATGFLGRNVLGRFVFSSAGELIRKIPVVGAVYASTKQVFETFIGDSKKNFGRVVMVSFPHSESWMIAFVISETAPREVQKSLKEPMLAVFVPTSPNPTSGFNLYIPASKTIPTQLKVDEAFKIILALGAGPVKG